MESQKIKTKIRGQAKLPEMMRNHKKILILSIITFISISFHECFLEVNK